jgi:hypothetical protein
VLSRGLVNFDPVAMPEHAVTRFHRCLAKFSDLDPVALGKKSSAAVVRPTSS